MKIEVKAIADEKLVYSILFRDLGTPADEKTKDKIISLKAVMLFNFFKQSQLYLYAAQNKVDRNYGGTLGRYFSQPLTEDLLPQTIAMLDGAAITELALVSKSFFRLLQKKLALRPDEKELLFTKTRKIILKQDDKVFEQHYAKKAEKIESKEWPSLIASVILLMITLLYYKFNEKPTALDDIGIWLGFGLGVLLAYVFHGCERERSLAQSVAERHVRESSFKDLLEDFKNPSKLTFFHRQTTAVVVKETTDSAPAMTIS